MRNIITKNSIPSVTKPHFDRFFFQKWLLLCSFITINRVSGGVVIGHVEFIISTSNSSPSAGVNNSISLVRCEDVQVNYPGLCFLSAAGFSLQGKESSETCGLCQHMLVIVFSCSN